MRMDGQTAVVVGAGTGHGTASAIRLALEGARVHVIDSDQGQVDAVVGTIKDLGGDVRGHRAAIADLAELTGIAAAVAEDGPPSTRW